MQITPAELDDDDEDQDTLAGMMGLRFNAKDAAMEGTRKKESGFTQRGSMYRFNPAPSVPPGGVNTAPCAPNTPPPIHAEPSAPQPCVPPTTVVHAPAPAPAPAAAPSSAAAGSRGGSASGQTYPVDVLKAAKPGSAGAPDINFASKEMYLSDADFEAVFKMGRAAWEAQPKWKRDDQKKKAGLF